MGEQNDQDETKRHKQKICSGIGKRLTLIQTRKRVQQPKLMMLRFFNDLGHDLYDLESLDEFVQSLFLLAELWKQ
jgi:hypothetical protein